MEKRVRKAVIPAAGYGTRFLPTTKAQPKEMMTIVDKPAIQYIVEEAVASGIEEICIIVGPQNESIKNHFTRSPELENLLENKGQSDLLTYLNSISRGVNFEFVKQAQVKGLGYAISLARDFVGNEPFAVLLADDIIYSPNKPCLKQVIEVFEKGKNPVIGIQPVHPSQVDKYGIIAGEQIDNQTFIVSDLVEKPPVTSAPSNQAVLGRYVLTPEVFECIDNTKPGRGGEIQLTDALRLLLKKTRLVAYAFEGQRYDTGDKLGYLKATVEFALRHETLRDEFKAYLSELNI